MNRSSTPPALSVGAMDALRCLLTGDTGNPMMLSLVMGNLMPEDFALLVQNDRVLRDPLILDPVLQMVPFSRDPGLLNAGKPPLWYRAFARVPVLTAAQIAQVPTILALFETAGADLLTVQERPSWSRRKGLALPAPLRDALIERVRVQHEQKELRALFRDAAAADGPLPDRARSRL